VLTDRDAVEVYRVKLEAETEERAEGIRSLAEDDERLILTALDPQTDMLSEQGMGYIYIHAIKYCLAGP